MDEDIKEVSLREAAQTIWSRRYLVGGVALLCCLVATVVAFVLPVKFEATAVLSPVSDDADSGKLGGAGALLSQFGGLAGLGGISLGSSGGKKSISIATLQSAALTEAFIQDRNLLPVLFSEKWDVDKQRWATSDPEKIPTLWKAERLFRKKIRSVVEDKKSGLVTLTITWKNPAQAADWATELVGRTNNYLRAQAIDQSKKNLDYLNDQLSKTSVVELQKAIYGLTENEIKKVMIANGSEEYAFRIIDPAQVPELRSSPKRLLIVGGGLLAGLFLGVFWVFAFPTRALGSEN